MRKRNTKFYFLAVFIFISSCGVFKGGDYQNVSYFQNLDHNGFYQENINNYSPFKIQPGDILGINVRDINQDAASVFNTTVTRVTGVSGVSGTASETNIVYGFKVDGSGNVQLPYVGNMKVAGLTPDEVSKQLTANLLQYLKSPIVNVRVLNFKISVFGDVLRPNVYDIQNEHINVNEAISLAGDLNITANRKNVLLVREEDGKRQFYTIDLTKKDLFDSPYYYLHNNDILYIDPDKTKYDTVSRRYKVAALNLAALSVLAIVLSGFLVYHH